MSDGIDVGRQEVDRSYLRDFQGNAHGWRRTGFDPCLCDDEGFAVVARCREGHFVVIDRGRRNTTKNAPVASTC